MKNFMIEISFYNFIEQINLKHRNTYIKSYNKTISSQNKTRSYDSVYQMHRIFIMHDIFK